MRFIVLLCAMFAASFAIAFEKDESLTAWYQALEKADVHALEGLMAPEDFSPFEYIVKDLDIKQDRTAFIASMAEWVGAIKNGSIEYKITDAFEGGYTAMVCYRFETSEFLAEETVGVYDTRVTFVEQSGKGNSCEGF